MHTRFMPRLIRSETVGTIGTSKLFFKPITLACGGTAVAVDDEAISVGIAPLTSQWLAMYHIERKGPTPETMCQILWIVTYVSREER